jgi:hypothetical protein
MNRGELRENSQIRLRLNALRSMRSAVQLLVVFAKS